MKTLILFLTFFLSGCLAIIDDSDLANPIKNVNTNSTVENTNYLNWYIENGTHFQLNRPVQVFHSNLPNISLEYYSNLSFSLLNEEGYNDSNDTYVVGGIIPDSILTILPDSNVFYIPFLMVTNISQVYDVLRLKQFYPDLNYHIRNLKANYTYTDHSNYIYFVSYLAYIDREFAIETSHMSQNATNLYTNNISSFHNNYGYSYLDFCSTGFYSYLITCIKLISTSLSLDETYTALSIYFQYQNGFDDLSEDQVLWAIHTLDESVVYEFQRFTLAHSDILDTDVSLLKTPLYYFPYFLNNQIFDYRPSSILQLYRNY